MTKRETTCLGDFILILFLIFQVGGIHSRFEIIRCFSCAKGTDRAALRGEGGDGGGVDVRVRAAPR